jgi:ribosomal protein L9
MSLVDTVRANQKTELEAKTEATNKARCEKEAALKEYIEEIASECISQANRGYQEYELIYFRKMFSTDEIASALKTEGFTVVKGTFEEYEPIDGDRLVEGDWRLERFNKLVISW